MNNLDFTTYSGKVKLGCVGDMATEWWTDEDWKEHKKYVDELKASGEYGKEVDISITLRNCPELDAPMIKRTMSAKMLIFEI